MSNDRSGWHKPLREVAEGRRELSFTEYHVVRPDGFTCSVCNDGDAVHGVKIQSALTENFHLVCAGCVEAMKEASR